MWNQKAETKILIKSMLISFVIVVVSVLFFISFSAVAYRLAFEKYPKQGIQPI